MPIAVGDIVTVVADGLFTDCQGTVIAIINDGDEDGSIEVEFGSEWRHRGHHWDGKTLLVRFLEEDLRIDSTWSTGTLAKRLYGTFFHSLYELKLPFVLGSNCMIKGCPNKIVMRCVINIWGTVCPIDLCEKCKGEYHGKCGESLPDLQFDDEAVPAT